MRRVAQPVREESTLDTTTILALIPLVIIQITVQLYALYDIYRRGGARSNTPVWVVVIVLFQLLGPIVYFALGRKEDVE